MTLAWCLDVTARATRFGNDDTYEDKSFPVKVYFPTKEISVTYLLFRILLETPHKISDIVTSVHNVCKLTHLIHIL